MQPVDNESGALTNELSWRPSNLDLEEYSAVSASASACVGSNSTLEKEILPPLLPGFELATFRSLVRRLRDGSGTFGRLSGQLVD